jgi:hypothetical protein
MCDADLERADAERYEVDHMRLPIAAALLRRDTSRVIKRWIETGGGETRAALLRLGIQAGCEDRAGRALARFQIIPAGAVAFRAELQGADATPHGYDVSLPWSRVQLVDNQIWPLLVATIAGKQGSGELEG